MAGRIPQSFIDDLLDRVDIVEVIGHRIDLKKAGRSYKARCPFHDEKTPSFNVTQDKQLYHCFGCGASGNAIGFVMDYDRINFVEAIEMLATNAGMEVPRETNVDSERQQKKDNLYSILEQCSAYYREQLRNHKSAAVPQQYLSDRGLSPEIGNRFGIGFAPDGWDNILSLLGSTAEKTELLKQAGMVVTNDNNRTYDRFRQRIMFPIRDLRGRTIAFGGRVLGDEKPKYLNSPETPVFNKSRELYGLYEARQDSKDLPFILLVEGYMDVIALAQYEIHNAVASLGTAFTEQHIEKLFRFTSEIVFCFDGDTAGRTAAARALRVAIPQMEDGYNVKFLFLPEGEDPDTLVRKIGKPEFILLAKRAQPLSDYLFDSLSEDVDTRTLDGRAKLSKLAAPYINQLPDGVFRQLMMAQLSERTGLDQKLLSSYVTPIDTQPVAEEYDYPPAAQDSPYPTEDYFSDQYEDQAPQNAPSQHRASRVKVTPYQRLTALLINNPSLAELTNQREQLVSFDDPGYALFNEVLEILLAFPDDNCDDLRARWGGKYGHQSDEFLDFIALADADWLVPPKETGRDDQQEFVDVYSHLLNRSLRLSSPPLIQLNTLLDTQNLTDQQKKQLFKIWHSLTENDKTPALKQRLLNCLK